ncbi:MFS transporter (plasmid) [Halostagnicola larsenii XH-48]|uniref:MFS transporter n=1 Tax=Halostagnicola larsenii XH-48 TaxID=797299 RepID=W0JWP8_9EURY|nr:MFS transporter [Halostagnicola larsenii]AHG01478.1 MFS transporter [Halostagnicola larsenii XH-48]
MWTRGFGVPSAVIAVLLSTFFLGFGGGVVFPILPNLGAVVGIAPFVVGIILSANRIVRLLANAPVGVVVDRIGTRKPFVVGVGLETIATLGYLIALESGRPALWFTGARVLWGLGSAFVLAAAYTIAADVCDPESRGQTMSIVRGGTSMGFPAGMAIGGIVGEVYGAGTAFGVASALSVLACLLTAVAIPETHGADRSTNVGLGNLDFSPPVLIAGGANFALLFTYNGVVFATLVSFLDVINAGTVTIGAQGTSGVLIGLSVLTGSVFSVAGGKASDLIAHRLPVILSCLGCLSVGVFLLAFGSTMPVLVASVLLLGAGQGGVGGPLVSMLGDLTASDRMGRATGTYNAFGDLGASVGLLVSLPLAEAIGFGSLYALSACVPIIAGALVTGGLYTTYGGIPSVVGS